MDINTAAGLLIPFLGTTLGAACVFFMKKEMNDIVQRALTRVCSGSHGGSQHMEPVDTGNRAE